NKERVTIVTPNEIEKFRQSHDDWRAMDFGEIGKEFGADYVIDMELASMSLYEPGSRYLFRGHIHVPIRIVDVNKDAVELFPPYDFNFEFPGSGQSIPADLDVNVEKFQGQFFAKIAVEMTRLFTSMPT